MREIKIVFNKEMHRVFSDKKMLANIFVLPIVLIVGMFFLMDTLSGMESSNVEKHKSVVYVANAPQEFKKQLDAADNVVVSYDDSMTKDSISEDIKAEKVDLAIIFDKSFESDVKSEKLQNVIVYHNPTSDNSSEAMKTVVNGVLESYRMNLIAQRFGSIEKTQIFTVNATEDGAIVDEQKAAGKILGQLFPYFLTIMLFAGAMTLGTDIMAGEKERGTLPGLMVTPVKRCNIAIGKLLSLLVLSILSALTYLVAMIISFKMMGGDGQMSEMSGAIGAFVQNMSVMQIAQLAIILIVTAFLYVSVVGLLSMFAKDIKTASGYTMPAYIVVIGVGMMTMFGSAVSEAMWQYAIPFYNTSIVLKGVLMGTVGMPQFLMAAGSTLLMSIIIIAVTTKLFESEKVVFNA